MTCGAPEDLPLVYKDSRLLVLNKPSGMLSVPGKGPDKQHCLSSWAQSHFPQARVVHRLDMGTSGLMVMALDATSQRFLSDAFAQRAVRKHYEAIVAGHTPATDADPEGWSLIDLPLRLDWERRPLRVIDEQQGKPSQTRWRLLQAEGDYSLLELAPLTGRSHQIRLHLQAMGHPIAGDVWYAPPTVALAHHRLLLHASKLALPHPDDSTMLQFTCASGFDVVLKQLAHTQAPASESR
jgi:tRNA pseudouridine32 synthase/23S rRNA pseudouridine746 synthase